MSDPVSYELDPQTTDMPLKKPRLNQNKSRNVKKQHISPPPECIRATKVSVDQNSPVQFSSNQYEKVNFYLIFRILSTGSMGCAMIATM